MRRGTLLALVVALSAYAIPAGASSEEAVGPAYVFAGGGTPLSNGIFFGGTTICDDAGCTVAGTPVEVPVGTDFTFVNLDAEAVGNGHQIMSVKKNKRTKKPLFYSDYLATPGEQDVVMTSHLKPGRYLFRCPVHFGMYGTIEVVEQ